MEKEAALTALSALAQDTRLDAFRLLVKHGPDGMLAGELAEALDARANTMSANLSVLLQAGLVSNTREGRAIRYRADMTRFRDLLAYLIEDCCGGRPGLCTPLLNELTQAS